MSSRTAYTLKIPPCTASIPPYAVRTLTPSTTPLTLYERLIIPHIYSYVCTCEKTRGQSVNSFLRIGTLHPEKMRYSRYAPSLTGFLRGTEAVSSGTPCGTRG